MRILLASAAAAFAFAATPAFAQYGGSPQEQVEGTPGEAEAAPLQDDEDAMAPEAEEGGYAGEDYAMADIDADADADVDSDVDADLDVDAEGATGKIEGIAAEDAGQIAPDDGEDAMEPAEDEGAPEQGATWQGEDGRAYCRRSDGTTGLVVGGGAGALVGRGIDGGRNRGAGTIIGAIAGAIVGSAVERSASQQNCR
jgi:hypothetical protein